jgi:hypothetical protein
MFMPNLQQLDGSNPNQFSSPKRTHQKIAEINLSPIPNSQTPHVMKNDPAMEARIG